MSDRTPLPEQLQTIERLVERAKAEQDWPTIAPLKATAELIRWTMANADTLKAADAVVRHPAVRAVLQALPGAEITAIREIEEDRNDDAMQDSASMVRPRRRGKSHLG